MEIIPNNLMGLFVGVSEPAQILFSGDAFRCVFKGERHDVRVAVLRLHFAEVQRVPVHTGRCACFETEQTDAHIQQVLAQFCSRHQVIGSAFGDAVPCETTAFHISAHAEHSRFTAVNGTAGSDNAYHLIVFHKDFGDFRLLNTQMRGFLQRMFHFLVVSCFVRLCPQRVHSGTFACIEHFGLDIGLIDILAHFAAQCVDFADKMAFGAAADGGVAGHHGNAVQTDGKHHRFHTQSGCCQCGFTACMTAAHNGNIYGFCFVHDLFSPLFGVYLLPHEFPLYHFMRKTPGMQGFSRVSPKKTYFTPLRAFCPPPVFSWRS